MGTAVEKARVIQFGKQATFDSAVAATFKYPGELTFNEEIDRYEPDYPQGVRAQSSGQLVEVRRGFSGNYKSELTFEELPLFLLSGLKGGVNAVEVGIGLADYGYTFNAPVAADPAPSYLTAEFAPNDFTTKWARAVPNVLASKYNIKWGPNSVAEFSADLFGGRVDDGITVTAALANVAGREVVKGNAFKVYIDSTSGGIGGTLKSGTIVSGDIAITPGVRPDYTTEGRADNDYSKYLFGDLMCEVKITMQYNANADAEFTAWRAATKRFLRIEATGSQAGTGRTKLVRLDGCFELVNNLVVGVASGNDIVTWTAKAKYDSSYAKMFELFVVNNRATIT